MGIDKHFAHSVEGKPLRDWHILEKHLANTAKVAKIFADSFDAGQWSYLAGMWHDLGKYSPDFQKRIGAVANDNINTATQLHVDHSTAGALYAVEQFGLRGRILAYLIAGHHAGLPDWEADETGSKALSQRLQNTTLLENVRDKIPTAILEIPIPDQKPRLGSDPAFWIRMLYSCLVDADFLDTETFLNPDHADIRGNYQPLSELLALFNDFMQEKCKTAEDTRVNQIRCDVLDRCIDMSANSPGIFSLTVPTGGGKTLSSMAFALNHAIVNGQKRIIYVIPYTSIIEQNADQFRKIFGENIIEHHSNLDVDIDSDDIQRSYLACENWDAPIIVTTSVQFFESLFAARYSRCRKLHNIANSVVILDEAQLLEPDFLNPILYSLNQLTKCYGVTVLLCTATQPALGKRDGFNGLENVREIIVDPAGLHDDLKRVKIQIPENLDEPIAWADLAERLVEHDSVLAIVNRRDDARELWSLMPKDTIHLSALMCGAHRSKVIDSIRDRLGRGEPVRVVSTQLVEAGVDFDFPVVYRALAGLDSIAQAAGRCNREGLSDSGFVHVFVPPSKSPPGLLRQTAEIGRRLLRASKTDPISPARFEEFFRELYWLRSDRLDRKGIMDDLASNSELRFSFRSAAQKFKLIDDLYESVIVQYGDGANLITKLAKLGPERWLMRKLQRYIVNIPRYVHKELVDSGAIHEPYQGVFVQVYPAMYSEQIGFSSDKMVIDDLII